MKLSVWEVEDLLAEHRLGIEDAESWVRGRYRRDAGPTFHSIHDLDRVEGEALEEWYTSAMLRRRAAAPADLGLWQHHSSAVWGCAQMGALLGSIEASPQGEFFLVRHFAPRSLRAGYHLVSALLDSGMEYVVAVTADLAPMLEKLGARAVGKVPQYFCGEELEKTVFSSLGSECLMALL